MWFRKPKSGAGTVYQPEAPAAPQRPGIETTSMSPDVSLEKAEEPGGGEIRNYDTMEEPPMGRVRFILIFLSIILSAFLVSLDRMIISTAIPAITDEFHSVDELGWYGSAFMLTTCSFQLLFGKLYSVSNIKNILLASIFLFEVGSAVCGTAPNSIAFICGRAIAGVGGAGIFTGGMMVIVSIVPLHKRPMYQGFFGAIIGASAAVGPLIGGAFTSGVTWRWCFYINLPFGAVAAILVVLLLRLQKRDNNLTAKDKLLQLDLVGTSLLIPGCVCLILALQWGGSEHPWNDARIIVLLILAFSLLIGFGAVQVLLPKTATLPPRIFKKRSIVSGFYSSMCRGAHQMITIYYLPIWFQAIRGQSALQSGIHILPVLLPNFGAAVVSGFLVRKIGYYMPLMIFGDVLACVGLGLLTTLRVGTPQANWVGYQVIYGWGLGCAFQSPNLAAQTSLPKQDVPIGMALMFFSQLLAGAIFVSVGQNVLSKELSDRLSNIHGFDEREIRNSGVVSLVDLPDSIKPAVLDGYNKALRQVFLVALIMACIGIFGSITMEWNSTKQELKQQGEDSNNGGPMSEQKGS